MNLQLLKFIKSARKLGYSDLQVREALLKQGWALEAVEEVFSFLNPRFKLKNQVCIFLGGGLIRKLEIRAKKNLFTVSEQIEDILRRSCLTKKTSKEEKLDDKLVALFSRKRKK